MPHAAPDVRAVVVSWNTRELLRACLASWEPEVSAGRAEVVVVDNASADGSAAMAREAFGWARVVEAESNLGFGRAVNRGAAGFAGRWLAIANADTALEPGALGALLAAGGRDPRAGALAPRLVLPDGTTQHSAFPFPTLTFTAAFALGLARVRARDLALVGHLGEAERRVPWAVAAFLLVRGEAWADTGGFDESQWMYAEDLDLGWRLARAGWATRWVPAARVRHHSGAAARQAFGDAAVRRQQRSTYAWMLRRRGAAVTRAVAALNVAGAAARAALGDRAARPWVRAHLQGLEPARRLRRHR